MAIGGKFPGSGYTDNKTGEPAGALASNLGRMVRRTQDMPPA
jgi:hypothetical protein